MALLAILLAAVTGVTQWGLSLEHPICSLFLGWVGYTGAILLANWSC